MFRQCMHAAHWKRQTSPPFVSYLWVLEDAPLQVLIPRHCVEAGKEIQEIAGDSLALTKLVAIYEGGVCATRRGFVYYGCRYDESAQSSGA